MMSRSPGYAIRGLCHPGVTVGNFHFQLKNMNEGLYIKHGSGRCDLLQALW